MKAPCYPTWHSVRLKTNKRELYERTVVLPGGGDLGNDMDCDLPATRPGCGASFHLLALCHRQHRDDSHPADQREIA
ncbi:hypothetical protein QWI28_06060 [Citrobacter freundii]|nr:hypothetical protein [Citrobacter freundii]